MDKFEWPGNKHRRPRVDLLCNKFGRYTHLWKKDEGQALNSERRDLSLDNYNLFSIDEWPPEFELYRDKPTDFNNLVEV